jgi:F-type H+-transporting ATPase subunit epsilon
MANKIEFELVSPARLLISEPVDMVVVPGTEGDFGVLPGHAPFISTVRADVIEVFEGREVRERIFVAGGFAEATPERCTVLAEEAVSVAELDRAAIDADVRRLEEARDADDDEERAGIEAALGVARAKLAVLDRLG